MRKLIAILIILIFSFDSAGYCLRVPMGDNSSRRFNAMKEFWQLGYDAKKGSEPAARALQNIILTSQNDSIRFEAVMYLATAAQKESQPAIKALQEAVDILLKKLRNFLKEAAAAETIEGSYKNKEVLSYLINMLGIKIRIGVHEPAAVRAAKSFIKAMDWDKDIVVISYSSEIDKSEAEKQFPDYQIEPAKLYNSSYIYIWFGDDGNTDSRVSSSHLNNYSIPYTPFKFDLLEPVSGEESRKIKDKLNIGQRKIIVLGSLSNIEMNMFVAAYNNLYRTLPIEKQPLLIVAPRYKEEIEGAYKILKSYYKNVKICGDAEDANGYNSLIINTSGKLLKLYSAGDVCVVGADHNILEPASQAKPTLYFPGQWWNNEKPRALLVTSGGALEFSQSNLHKIMNGEIDSALMAQNALGVIKDLKGGRTQKAIEDFVATAILPSLFMAIDRQREEMLSQLIIKLKRGVALDESELDLIGFKSNQDVFEWVYKEVRNNQELMSGLSDFDRNGPKLSGTQLEFIIDPSNPHYGIKILDPNYDDVSIYESMNAFELTAKRLGGLVTPFFLPADFRQSHSVAVRRITALTDSYISEKGKAFIDEYMALIESYWKRGIFDRDFKLDGLGIDENGELIVLDFGLSQDIMREDLFSAPATNVERYKNTFNLAIGKILKTRKRLRNISQDLASYFEKQWEDHYGIKLLLKDWKWGMQGTEEVNVLGRRLSMVVRNFRPSVISENYVFPFIGGPFDRFIELSIRERCKQYKYPYADITKDIRAAI